MCRFLKHLAYLACQDQLAGPLRLTSAGAAALHILDLTSNSCPYQSSSTTCTHAHADVRCTPKQWDAYDRACHKQCSRIATVVLQLLCMPGCHGNRGHLASVLHETHMPSKSTSNNYCKLMWRLPRHVCQCQRALEHSHTCKSTLYTAWRSTKQKSPGETRLSAESISLYFLGPSTSSTSSAVTVRHGTSVCPDLLMSALTPP